MTEPPDPNNEETPPGSVPPPESYPTQPQPPTGDYGQPPAAEPPTAEPPTAEPPTAEPPTAEPPTAEHPTAEHPTAEHPTTGGLPTPPPGPMPPPPGPMSPPPGGYGQPPSGEYAEPPGAFPAMPPAPASEYGYVQPGAPGYGQPGYPMVPPGMYYDPQSGLVLPEGVVLASVGRRIGAFFLAIPLAIVTLGIGYIIWGLIVWANGTTPALQVLGMRCWRPEDNRVPGWWWMALRNVVGHIAESILGVITDLVSFVLMCVNKDRKSLHDLIAGTVVLHDPNKVLDSRPS